MTNDALVFKKSEDFNKLLMVCKIFDVDADPVMVETGDADILSFKEKELS